MPSNNENLVQYSFWLDKQLMGELKQLAKHEDRSVAWVIRQACTSVVEIHRHYNEETS